ncbi:MAG: hypothetical protein GTO51_01670 [Candidatus Latescibacteria bacterium]|nr:hypothetical protein [Candidatus Latescibacterota bacterium]NIM22135.1 hypothetical protein [Candidatus Latescibacterota bacterium]NIM64685.1 hypothetical protein [Candidatus Latescibacterota bacterium]NIO01195.1 hypothetical protein [Candidatus Latescibacterota bacterium]NIO27580.1 hypothetical protein [Candidatus Latescibacterota bacterium]
MRFTPRLGVFIFALILTIFLADAVNAQYFGRNKIQYKDYKWEILSTPHFEIHFYEGEEPFAARTALLLENGYQMLADKLRTTLPWKVPVILYASHNDFQQTNVSSQLLPEGVQAFAEPSRKRIVLPFSGSFRDFRHTAIHELAHVFTFNIVYNRLLDNVFSRNYLFAMPLWIAEGIAEYLAVGWDADSDMFIRDAVIYDYIAPLDAVGGFYVYKEGQSVFNYIDETYGKEKVLEILDVLSTTRSGSAALEATLGLDTRELGERWEKWLRKHYWPLYSHKMDVEEVGRRLTDHVKDHGYYNTKPVLSPDGEKIAFFSDRGGLISIFIMSALDGEIIKKLVTGQRSNRFESLHSYTSSLSFSPDGSRIAFAAKSKGHDALFIVDANKGDVLKKIDVHADGLSAPDWSPMGDTIVITATIGGQSDLLLIDVENGSYRRLTNDAADQLTPRFYPDGKRIVFTYYPEVTSPVPVTFTGENKKILSEMDFLSPDNVKHDVSLDIYEMDLESASIRPLIQTDGDDNSPLVLKDGKTLIFTSNESGIDNLYAGNVETGEYHRFTDILGGLFTPDVDEEKGRITFAAFIKGGYDIFVSDDFDNLVKRRYKDLPVIEQIAVSDETDEIPAETEVIDGDALLVTSPKAELSEDVIAKASVDSASLAEEVLATASTKIDSLIPTISPSSLKEPEARLEPARLDSMKAKRTKQAGMIEGVTTAVRSEETQTKGATVAKYKTRFAPDYIGQGGLYYSTGFGFGLANTIALSDLLGDHRLLFSFSLYRDFENSDFLASYYYLKKRINYGFGVFQFKNYLNSRLSSIGESFANYRLFSERNYGFFGLVSIPFNTFYRMDLELQAFVSEREFFERVEEDPFTSRIVFIPSQESSRRLIEPALSFTHDSSFWSYFGPVEGSRWTISLSKGLSLGGDEDVSRTTVFLDYRWYKRLFYRNSFAFRLAGAMSEGDDARSFFLGGPTTLRGYDYLSFFGTRMGLMSIEYRYPLLDALIFGWPGRWGFTNIGGTLFFDVGAAWDKDDFTPFKKNVSGLQFEDLRGDFGFGAYFNLGFLLLNFQFAWPTDMKSVGDNEFHFFIGPTF